MVPPLSGRWGRIRHRQGLGRPPRIPVHHAPGQDFPRRVRHRDGQRPAVGRHALSLRPDRRRAGGTNACARTCARPAPCWWRNSSAWIPDVLFEFNKATLKPAASQALDNLFAQILAANPKDGVATVIGHTDRIGSEAYNQSLSEQRARTVADYLIAKGIVCRQGACRRAGRVFARDRGSCGWRQGADDRLPGPGSPGRGAPDRGECTVRIMIIS